MGGSDSVVAGLLTALVQRSGLTSAEVAARANVSHGTLRRYLRGDVVPSAYEPLERIGVACGANEWQLDRLCERWRDDVDPLREVTYRGVQFRGTRQVVGSGLDAGDLKSRVMKAVWVALGSLAPVDARQPRAFEVRDDLLLDTLVSDRRLRASTRRAVLGRHRLGHGRVDIDPGMFRRRVEAMVPGLWESYPSRRRDAIGRGLLDPDDAIVACAVEIIRNERNDGDGKPRLTERDPQAAERAVDRLGDEWVDRWVGWGSAGAPADRSLVEDGIRRCYELSGQAWHGRVVWVDSPLTGALLLRHLGATVLWRTRDPARDRENVWAVEPDDLRYRMHRELRDLVGPALLRHVETTVQARVGGQLPLGMGFFDDAALMGQPHIGATDETLVRQALAGAAAQLPRKSRAGLHRRLAAGDVVESSVSLDRYPHIHGQTLAPWLATATLLRQVCGAGVAGSLWDRMEAYSDANAAGPWSPLNGYAIVAERPHVVRSEYIDPSGQSQGHRRLHADDGAAVLWSDGTASHIVHGLRLPFDLMQPGRSIQRILHERNAEIRRIAIERFGWDRFVIEADLTLVHGPVADPGNPANTLSLYDLPASYGVGTRLLLCTNASPERDGTVRRFGLHVPATIDDAVAAAAWTFDVDRKSYERLDHAT